MKTVAKITSKGQITIPLEIRRLLGVGAGDFLEFLTQGNTLTVVPKRQQNLFANPPIQKYRLQGQTDAIGWQRELRGHDQIDDLLFAQTQK